MNILVGGSFRDAPDSDALQQFFEALGRTIVERGHVLYNGCRNPADREVATSANAWLVANGRDPKDSLISYWQRDVSRVHHYGLIRVSALADWAMSHPRLRVPEQVDKADVAIFVAGNEGTYTARNWAQLARKRIVGVPHFGGAGKEIYDQELSLLLQDGDHARSRYYEGLADVPHDLREYATQVISVCERLLVPKTVFAVLSFKKKWQDVFQSFQVACHEHDFQAERTDETLSLERVNIEKLIAESAFVLADVSDDSQNVFFEIGYARGCGKPLILTAATGTTLPFDVADVPTLFWENQDELREKLRKSIGALSRRLRRQA